MLYTGGIRIELNESVSKDMLKKLIGAVRDVISTGAAHIRERLPQVPKLMKGSGTV